MALDVEFKKHYSTILDNASCPLMFGSCNVPSPWSKISLSNLNKVAYRQIKPLSALKVLMHLQFQYLNTEPYSQVLYGQVIFVQHEYS